MSLIINLIKTCMSGNNTVRFGENKLRAFFCSDSQVAGAIKVFELAKILPKT